MAFNKGDRVRIINLPWLQDQPGTVDVVYETGEYTEIAVDGREGFFAVAVENLELIDNKEEQ